MENNKNKNYSLNKFDIHLQVIRHLVSLRVRSLMYQSIVTIFVTRMKFITTTIAVVVF